MAPLFKEGDIMSTLTWVHICFMTNLSYPHHFSKRCISIDCQHLRDTKNDLQDIEVEIRFSQFYVCFGSLNFMCVRWEIDSEHHTQNYCSNTPMLQCNPSETITCDKHDQSNSIHQMRQAITIQDCSKFLEFKLHSMIRGHNHGCLKPKL